ncbi:MAG TPA: protoporphyrinogen oxidase [Microscillaceae bacterium]|jgi:oxygen-dependent protoporphyrinogen oxidase|nr:protoporphyrinogen oxidase [Microscillaceae bacterium]
MVCIIGGGISGLSLAYYFQKKGVPFFLLEADEQPGGVIRSEQATYTTLASTSATEPTDKAPYRTGGVVKAYQHHQYQLEYGPNSILADPFIEQLIDELELRSEVLETLPVSKNRYIFRKGRYRKLPTNPLHLVLGGFFSAKTKWAIWRETRQKPQAKPIANETLSEFFSRHFSQEIVDYALNPFVAGIYAGNPDTLLLEKTFPQLAQFEQTYGSIIRGFIKASTGARKKTLTFKNGLQTLPLALANGLKGSIQYNATVEKVYRENGKWAIETTKATYEADQVVVATPAYVAAGFLEETFPTLAGSLRQIYYPPMAVVHSVFNRRAVKHPLDGFGGLNPALEQQFTLGSIWSSAVFPGRCKTDVEFTQFAHPTDQAQWQASEQVLFTSFVGGSRFPEVADWRDEDILQQTTQELQRNFQISQAPVFQKLTRWNKAIPQYDKGVLEAHQQTDALAAQQVWFCANWKDGISLPDCIKKAKSLADQWPS